MRILFLSFLLSVSAGFAQTPCVGNTADGYPCEGFDLIAHFSLNDMNANDGNDSWGWVDPDSNIEYAIVGLDNGTAFFNLSDPVNPVYLGKLPTHTGSSFWRDIKVYQNHAFIVSDINGNHGMQVFDLTRLRNVASPPETFTEDFHYDLVGSCHNIAINEDTGYAYLIGCDDFSGGPVFVNLSIPNSPVSAGGYAGSGYTHDAQIITYDGPDTDYIGKEILFGSNEDRVVIVDVTNKANPQLISTITYANTEYTHQGWLTEDRKYFMVGDELDEIFAGIPNTRTLIFDVEDLDNPSFSFEYFGPTPATDHNGYVKGDVFYMANYNAGLRAIDISNIESGIITEIGYFDTYPSDNDTGYSGSWNVYPYLPSGNIIISGTNGFTLVRNPALNVEDIAQEVQLSIYPNPVNNELNIELQNETIQTVEVTNILGQKMSSFSNLNVVNFVLDTSKYPSGIYVIHINETLVKKFMK